MQDDKTKIDRTESEVKVDLQVRRQHHIWCNYWHGDPATCKFCNRLYKEYPMDGLTPDELQQKYFPNVIKRT